MNLSKLFLKLVLSGTLFISTTKLFAQELPKPIQAYQLAWSESNAKDRLAILNTFWTDKSIYEDPSMNIKGVASLKETIDKFWQDFPGASFETGPLLSQGYFYTWTWSILDRNKNILLKGVDVAEINAQGQMLHLIGFWHAQK